MDLRIRVILWKFDSEKRSMDKTLSWISMDFPWEIPSNHQTSMGNPYKNDISLGFPLDFTQSWPPFLGP